MEREEKKDVETTPMDVSLEQGTENESEPKPMGASIKGGDEKEYSATPLDAGELLSMAKEDEKNPEAPAGAIVPSLFVDQESKGENEVPAEGHIKSLSAQEEKGAETMVKPAALLHSVGKEKRSSETLTETSSKFPTAKKKTAVSLKAWAMTTKKFPMSIKRKVKPSDLKAARSKYMKKKKVALLSNNNGDSRNEQDIKASTSGDKSLPENLSEVKAAEKEIIIQVKGGEKAMGIRLPSSRLLVIKKTEPKALFRKIAKGSSPKTCRWLPCQVQIRRRNWKTEDDSCQLEE